MNAEKDAMIESLMMQMNDVYLGIKRYKATNQILADGNRAQQVEIIALKAVIANLRKQKVYAGQKFYDPSNHKAPTIYLCARWNEWYMIRQQNRVEPELMSQEQFNEAYGHYELMPRQNSNLKNIK